MEFVLHLSKLDISPKNYNKNKYNTATIIFEYGNVHAQQKDI